MTQAAFHAWRWTVVVLIACVLATASLYATRGWIWLGVAPIGIERVPFSDAAAQLSAADFCSKGFGEHIGGVCFVPSAAAPTHSQTYQPWLAFQRLGLTAAIYRPVAFAMIGLFYLAFCLTLRPRSGGEAFWTLALLFSSAIQLAVERANFDLLTGALLCLAASLLTDRRRFAVLCGCLVLGLDTCLKLYTG